MSQKIIGIDLGGTSVKLAIISQEGDILQKWSIPTNVLDNGQHIVPDIIHSIKHRLDMYQMNVTEFLGIGMGSPGQVDAKVGTVIGAYNLGWSQQQLLKEQFSKKFDLPFVVDNDANVAALGERWVGAGHNAEDVVFITLGTGVGGGIISNGSLIRGVRGCAGEIGHLTVQPSGFLCTCGKVGCLETVASATGIVNLARQKAEAYVGKSLLKERVDEGNATAKDVFDLAKAGDVFAISIVDEFASYLATACAHIGHLLNPEYIVIGGGVSAAGDYLLEKVTKAYEAQVLPLVKASTKLTLATLGNDAGMLGAASLVLEQR